MSNRREFLIGTAAITAVTLSPLISTAESFTNAVKRIKLRDNSVILFQGDSITDSGRDKTVLEANNPLGLSEGYAGLVSAQLLFNNPTKKLQIYNRGISGNKVFQLAARWDKECLELKPDVLSILVGVNDFWHTLNNGYKGTIETYRDDYMKLLKTTKDKLPDVQLIIAEPFSVPGLKAVDDKWYGVFDAYSKAAKEIANEFDAVFIPLQSIFNEAQKAMPGVFWTKDGVHPSLAGKQIMAKAWLDTFK